MARGKRTQDTLVVPEVKAGIGPRLRPLVLLPRPYAPRNSPSKLRQLLYDADLNPPKTPPSSIYLVTPRSPPHAQNASFFAYFINPLRSPWKSGRHKDNVLGKVGTKGRRNRQRRLRIRLIFLTPRGSPANQGNRWTESLERSGGRNLRHVAPAVGGSD